MLWLLLSLIDYACISSNVIKRRTATLYIFWSFYNNLIIIKSHRELTCATNFINTLYYRQIKFKKFLRSTFIDEYS